MNASVSVPTAGAGGAVRDENEDEQGTRGKGQKASPPEIRCGSRVRGAEKGRGRGQRLLVQPSARSCFHVIIVMYVQCPCAL